MQQIRHLHRLAVCPDPSMPRRPCRMDLPAALLEQTSSRPTAARRLWAGSSLNTVPTLSDRRGRSHMDGITLRHRRVRDQPADVPLTQPVQSSQATPSPDSLAPSEAMLPLASRRTQPLLQPELPDVYLTLIFFFTPPYQIHLPACAVNRWTAFGCLPTVFDIRRYPPSPL